MRLIFIALVTAVLAPVVGWSEDVLVLRDRTRQHGAVTGCRDDGCRIAGRTVPRELIAWVGLGRTDGEPAPGRDVTKDQVHLVDGRVVTGEFGALSLGAVAIGDDSFDRDAVAWIRFAGAEPAAEVPRASPARPPQQTMKGAIDPYNEGIEHLAANRWSEAAAAFERAIKAEPSDKDALVQLGNVYLQLDRHEDSVTAYREATRLDDRDAEAYSRLGTALTHLGRWEEVADAWTQWARLEPDSPLAHSSLGYARIGVKRFGAAADALRTSIRLAPGDAGTHTNLGVALHGMKKYEQAIAAYETAVKLDPKLPETYYGLGRAYHAAGNRAAANRQLLVLRGLHPRLAEDLETVTK